MFESFFEKIDLGNLLSEINPSEKNVLTKSKSIYNREALLNGAIETKDALKSARKKAQKQLDEYVSGFCKAANKPHILAELLRDFLADYKRIYAVNNFELNSIVKNTEKAEVEKPLWCKAAKLMLQTAQKFEVELNKKKK